MVIPKRYNFVLVSGELVRETNPVNWAKFEQSLSRDRLGINKEITTSLEFVGLDRDFLKSLYDASGSNAACSLYFYRRKNDWTGVTHGVSTPTNVLKADFSDFKDDYPRCSVSFKEQTIRQLINDNKSTEYEIPIPYKSGGSLASDAVILKYTGCYQDRTNRVAGIIGGGLELSTWQYVLRSNRTVAAFTDLLDINMNFASIKAVSDVEIDVEYSVGYVRADCSNAYDNARIYLVIIRADGDQYILRQWSPKSYVSGGGRITQMKFQNNTVYTTTVDLRTGDTLAFITNGMTGVSVSDTSNLYLRVVSNEPSPFTEYEIPVMSYKSAIEKVLAKFAPDAILEYNLPETGDGDFDSFISSGSGLYQSETPKINISFEKLLKAVSIQYGADVRYSGNTITIDYASSFFKDEEADELYDIRKFSTAYSNEHVYGEVTVGYDTDTDTDNGLIEFNGKTVFRISTIESKQLDLVHPFKASQFTIEKFLTNKSADSTKSDQSDNSVFLFACNHPVNKYTTLYRPTVSGNLPAGSFNFVLSPIHLLIANARYIGVSLYGTDKKLVYASTDAKSDYQFSYGGNTYTLNSGEDALLVSGLSNPLFLPIECTFTTSYNFADIDPSHSNMYKYFTTFDKYTEKTYKVFINDITLRMTGEDLQEWNTIVKQ